MIHCYLCRMDYTINSVLFFWNVFDILQEVGGLTIQEGTDFVYVL